MPNNLMKLFADADGHTRFTVLGYGPTGESISYLTANRKGKAYRYGFDPEKETIEEAKKKFQKFLSEQDA